MQKHGILDDGQTETRAAHITAAAFIDTIEAFKDAVQMFCWDSYTIVAEGECPMGALVFSRNLY